MDKARNRITIPPRKSGSGMVSGPTMYGRQTCWLRFEGGGRGAYEVGKGQPRGAFESGQLPTTTQVAPPPGRNNVQIHGRQTCLWRTRGPMKSAPAWVGIFGSMTAARRNRTPNGWEKAVRFATQGMRSNTEMRAGTVKCSPLSVSDTPSGKLWNLLFCLPTILKII